MLGQVLGMFEDLDDVAAYASAGLLGLATGGWLITTVDLQPDEMLATGIMAATAVGTGYTIFNKDLV